MINIVYIPGTFGSMIEYVLRSHTKEHNLESSRPLVDGSMHGFDPQAHIVNRAALEEYFESQHDDHDVISISWPMNDYPLAKILQLISQTQTQKYKNLIIYYDNFDFAEQNLLFQYHKIAFGQRIKNGLKIFYAANTTDFNNWDPTYTTYGDMQPWQFREWFSIFYPNMLFSLIKIPEGDDNSLVVNANDILHNTIPTLLRIIDFCELTINKNLLPFVDEWQDKQQYILQEYQTVRTIVDCTIKNIPYTWTNLNIIAEAIVQQQLRRKGYELRCDGLNIFPTNSLDLHQLIAPNWRIE